MCSSRKSDATDVAIAKSRTRFLCTARSKRSEDDKRPDAELSVTRVFPGNAP
jgi:hypothetical protein